MHALIFIYIYTQHKYYVLVPHAAAALSDSPCCGCIMVVPHLTPLQPQQHYLCKRSLVQWNVTASCIIGPRCRPHAPFFGYMNANTYIYLYIHIESKYYLPVLLAATAILSNKRCCGCRIGEGCSWDDACLHATHYIHHVFHICNLFLKLTAMFGLLWSCCRRRPPPPPPTPPLWTLPPDAFEAYCPYCGGRDFRAWFHRSGSHIQWIECINVKCGRVSDIWSGVIFIYT